jgi:ABC-type multidrug transport system ATPase subunit
MTARPDASQGALIDLGSRRLEDRVKEVLREQRVAFEARSLSFAVDFVRLSIRALSLATLGDAERRILASAVRARAGLDDDAIRILLDLAMAPQFRSSMSALDLRAFEARFGEEAAELLREEEREELDLPGFGARHGSGGALLLVDTMFAVSAARGEITADLKRLRHAADELGVDEVLVSALLQKHDPRLATGDLLFPLQGRDRFVIGRATGCDITLADPQVAMRHAELLHVEGNWRIVDLGSGRPTVVNGVPVSSAPIDSNARIRMGPWSLRLAKDDDNNDVLQAFGERSFSALSVRQVSRQVDGRSLLDDVSFTVFSGEVVALVGPSGAGKTTLLNAISGVAPADTGEVLLDGQDFHQLLGLDRSLVGIVPQDDLVHPELTVEESLLYSGRIRFASDVTRAEIQAEATRVLDELGIAHIAGNRIGDALRRGISGGQRKRVNLGQELMTRSTRLLFLDEPTSGLDPRAAQDIVRLVRQLADVGRIVFLVTHDLSPQVMAQVDHVLVLASGGRLAYFGPPSEACAYFAVPTPDAIFDRFSEHAAEEWGRRYKESTDLRKYVTTREYLLGLEGLQ